jgi:predicted O-linked N-acetylglucosamine transferase (SPINDLY family)
MATIAEALTAAVQLHQAGDLARAEQIYRQILQVNPAEANALHLLGLLTQQQGHPQAAVDLIRRAVAVLPQVAELHCNLANAYLALERWEEAAASARQALRLRPDLPEGHTNLGDALVGQQRWPEAISCYRQALALRPGFAEAHTKIGQALAAQGQIEEALAFFREALRLRPELFEAHLNLGGLLKKRGLLTEAEASFRQALRLRPKDADVHNNLGATLAEQERFEEAVSLYRAALRLNPEFAEAYLNLGAALARLCQHDEGIACLEQAVRLQPALAEAWNGLGNFYKDQGRTEEALACYRNALAVKPDDAVIQSNLLLALHYSEKYDPESCFREHALWGEQLGEARPYCPLRPLDRDPGRRLRIGYVSGDFRDHVMGHYCLAIFPAHDRSQIEVFGYSNTPHVDRIAQRLRDAADHWLSIVGLSDRQVADRIREDRIDILVDLAGHTGGNRLGVFTCKPAPIQVTHCGYPDTSGLAAMDYRLMDVHTDPPGQTERFHREKLWRLPQAHICFAPPCPLDVGPLPARTVGHVTFGSLNALAKVTDGMIGLWAQILQQVPRSRMLLLIGVGTAGDERVRKAFARHEIGPERLTLAGRQGREVYYRHYASVDICLDTHPYSGCCTTTDALWMGVPVVLLAGPTCVSRLGIPALTHVGLRDLVTATPAEYLRVATELAGDLARLEELRGQLRERMRRSPPMDIPGFTRELERAYRRMWEEFCRGPESDQVSANDAEREYQAGLVLARQRRFPEAEARLRQALQLSPARADIVNHLAGTQVEQGKFAESLATVDEALRLRPDLAEAHYHRGLALEGQGNTSEAAAAFAQAVRLQPDYPEALNNLGNALRRTGRPKEAEACYRELLRLRPEQADAHNHLGAALAEQGRVEDALAAYQEALVRQPDLAGAHYNLGLLLVRRGKPDEAQPRFEQALRIKPDFGEALDSLATLYKDQGRVEEAIACLRRAVAVKPELHYIQSNLLFALHYHAGYDPESVFAEHRRWGSQFDKPPAVQPLDRDPSRRLRIGYVSADFREHVVGRYCEAVIAAHDHSQVEVFCYANVRKEDARSKRIQAAADHWRSIVQLSDTQAADLIRQDRLDLLIDLAGHSGENRLGVFARKPAAIQATHCGYPDTTGLGTVDYRLSDAYCDPPGQTERYHTEQLLRLPVVQWCYVPWPEQEGKSLPAERLGRITFGSLNNLAKVTDAMLELWARILRELPEARLIISSGAGRAGDERVCAVFRRSGIAEERVTLVGKRGIDAYFRLYDDVDICLDTFPHTGCLTTADALWMGVPVVTLAGPTYLTRQGVAILSQVGLEDLIADTPEAYVAAAVRLARDLPRLRELRAGLRQRLAQSPLTDVHRFTRDLETAYRTMWQRSCSEAPAEAGLAIFTFVAEPEVCARVRVEEPQEFLNSLPGVRAAMVNAIPINALAPGEQGVFVWQRVVLTPAQHLTNLRDLLRQGYLIITEIDDDPERCPGFAASNYFAFRCCHGVQASTEPLAAYLRQFNPNVVVFANQLARLPPPRVYPADGPVALFFGSLDREQDWQPIMPALNRVLRRFRDEVRVQVMCDRRFFEALETESKTFAPFRPYAEYQALLHRCDIALLPLLPGRFNEMKSDLKFLECAGNGVVALASPMVYAGSIVEGETGFLYQSAEEFEEKLSRLVENQELRHRIAENAYRWVGEHRLLVRHFWQRGAWYRDLLARLPQLNQELRQRAPEFYP